MKGNRSEYWAAVVKITEALLDSNAISYGGIHVVQHSTDGSGFYCYLETNITNLDEERYDKLRKIVNGLGGSVSVADADKADRHNVRIWPIKEAA